LPSVTPAMLIVCPSCASAFMICPTHLGCDGRHVRCASCHSTWFAAPERKLTLEVGREAEPDQTRPTRGGDDAATLLAADAEPAVLAREDHQAATRARNIAAESVAGVFGGERECDVDRALPPPVADADDAIFVREDHEAATRARKIATESLLAGVFGGERVCDVESTLPAAVAEADDAIFVTEDRRVANALQNTTALQRPAEWIDGLSPPCSTGTDRQPRIALARRPLSHWRPRVTSRRLLPLACLSACSALLSFLIVHAPLVPGEVSVEQQQAAPVVAQMSTEAQVVVAEPEASNKMAQAMPILHKDYILGAGGWHFERLPDEIFILRTVIAEATGSGRSGLFLIFCQGSSRILKFRLPDPAPVLAFDPKRAVIHMSADTFVEANVQIQGGVISLSSMAGDMTAGLKNAGSIVNVVLTGDAGQASLKMIFHDPEPLKALERSCSNLEEVADQSRRKEQSL
jgi:predicted Zn finger-like uncharacterized protein